MKTFYCGAFDEGDKSAPTEDVFPACKYTSQENNEMSEFQGWRTE
jgi:hypothetical protein